MKRDLTRLWVALMAACGLSTGCVPFPHRVNTTPWIAGKLESGGAPVANRDVRVFAAEDGGRACEGNSIQATTNEFGKFALPPARQMAWMMAMMAHRRFHWNLCVEDGGQLKPIKQNADYTLVDEGPYWLAELRCVLSQNQGQTIGHCEETRRGHSRSEVETWLRKP